LDGSVQFLGHAGFIVRHRGVSVLIDPWFHSAFLASWFPYPDNSFLLPEIRAGRFDYLYISHAHEDHLDERVLQSLDRSITVIAPRFRSGAMVERFRRLGFETIIALDHKQRYELSRGFVATMYLDTSHKEDSGLLLEMDAVRFLDLNDCNTPMSELPASIDLLAAQFSGAMWYPNCYDYPADIMQAKVRAVRRDLLDTLGHKVQLTGAKAYIPSAGPACFLDPALADFNDGATTIFPQWEDVAALFESRCPDTRVLRMGPGDMIRFEADRPVVEALLPARPIADLALFREQRRDQWMEFHAGAEPEIETAEIARYFADLQERNQHLLQGFEKEIGLSTGTRCWRIRLGATSELRVSELEAPFAGAYSFTMAPRVLRAILDRSTGWEEALLSLRVALRRDPDVFDLTLVSLLRYGNEPLQTLQLVRDQRSTETIERDGLRMQRFCPHAGEDLARASLRDGILECPRHHWQWDVQTGVCVAGGNLKLRVEALGEDGSGLPDMEAERDPAEAD
jgi:UDP-MurNAc hydroxylase